MSTHTTVFGLICFTGFTRLDGCIWDLGVLEADPQQQHCFILRTWDFGGYTVVLSWRSGWLTRMCEQKDCCIEHRQT